MQVDGRMYEKEETQLDVKYEDLMVTVKYEIEQYYWGLG